MGEGGPSIKISPRHFEFLWRDLVHLHKAAYVNQRVAKNSAKYDKREVCSHVRMHRFSSFRSGAGFDGVRVAGWRPGLAPQTHLWPAHSGPLCQRSSWRWGHHGEVVASRSIIFIFFPDMLIVSLVPSGVAEGAAAWPNPTLFLWLESTLLFGNK